MSCLVVAHHPSLERGYEYACAVKGAPESMRPLFAKLPENYDELSNLYSSKGYRVLALGYKPFDHNTLDLDKLTRTDVESNLIFCGFLLARSTVKKDCIVSISNLHKMGVETAMISGDSPLTACHVSTEIGIFKKSVLILYKEEKSNKLIFKGYGFDFKQYFDSESIDELAKEYQLCITGDALKTVQISNPEKSVNLISKSKVFARFDPHQKEFVIKIFKSLGFVTLMCGDGANDIGALRMADIGVAMLNTKESDRVETPVEKLTKTSKENKMINKLNSINSDETKPGDASVAAPFTLKGSELMRCVDFLKFCNCSLVYFQHVIIVSTITCFTYVYLQATHYSAGLIFSEMQQISYGIINMLIYYSTFQTTPTEKIPNLKPVKSLFHPYICLSILFQSVIHIYTVYFLSTGMGIDFPVPDPLQENAGDILKNFKPSDFNTVLLYFEFFVMLAIYIVNYCVYFFLIQGSPFYPSIMKNKTFLGTVVITYLCMFLCLFDLLPFASRYLQITVLSREVCFL